MQPGRLGCPRRLKREIGGLHDVQRLEGEIVGKALCGKRRRASAPGS
jgi:hypothetical protein